MQRILLVEDDPILRETFAEIIGFESYQVDTVANGKEALQFLANQTVELIVSDVRMPVMGGIELLHEIKTKIQDPPPVLLISGYSEEYTREKVIELGAADLLGKPVNIDDFLARIKKFF